MTALAALPTRRDEDWRYADLGAVAGAWPLPAPERIAVAAGGDFARTLMLTTPGVLRLELDLAAGARAALHVLNAGEAYGRVELAVTLGEGADFTLGAAQIAGPGATREIVTTMHHAAPGAASRQIVRSVAKGGTANALGRICVARGADGTDADQSLRAILLDGQASANARPELEIFADDVKCAHGCAVGALDEGALFYMAARGLGPAAARRLMLEAFIAGAFADAGDEAELRGAALAALEALA